MPPEQMEAAFALRHRQSGLSANDCICMITAQCHEDGILLTGDRLRSAAEKAGVRVHGVLWIIDELKAANGCDDALLVSALETWKADRSVFLPEDLIDQRIQRLRRQNCSGSRPCLDPLRFRYRFPLIRHACIMNRIRVEMEIPE